MRNLIINLDKLSILWIFFFGRFFPNPKKVKRIIWRCHMIPSFLVKQKSSWPHVSKGAVTQVFYIKETFNFFFLGKRHHVYSNFLASLLSSDFQKKLDSTQNFKMTGQNFIKIGFLEAEILDFENCTFIWKL